MSCAPAPLLFVDDGGVVDQHVVGEGDQAAEEAPGGMGEEGQKG